MRQVCGGPFGLIVGVEVTFLGGEALVDGEVRRLILRCAQNDTGTGEAFLGLLERVGVLRCAQNDKGNGGG
jgi:hypothetical protein